MFRLFVTHAVEDRGRSAKIMAQAFEKICIHPLVFFFQRNRQSKDLAFRQFLEVLHSAPRLLYPNHFGFAAVPSKWAVVLNSSKRPSAAASRVRSSNAAICCCVMGWKVLTAVNACSITGMESIPVMTTETGCVNE